MRGILAAIGRGGDRSAFHDRLIAGVYSPAFLRAQQAAFAARRAQLDQIPAGWFEGVDALLAALESFDLRERAAVVRCPALVVTAGDDRVMPAERSRALAALLHAEMVGHPSAGHALIAEEPEWVANVLLDFLARHCRAGGAPAGV
jgi:pimeloyl-ACP methyl ester carboxylesterase